MQTVTEEEVVELQRRLARYDAASRSGPWTRQVLSLIAEQPGVPAADLAVALQVDKQWLKTNVRKLKNMGFTESLRVGYRLSPRGCAFLDHAKRSA